MENDLLFPFSTYWTFYLGFIGVVITLLLLDLGLFHRKAHVVSIKESVFWSCVWIACAMLFNVALYYYSLREFPSQPDVAWQVALEFMTGYVIEKSLAIDNIFVFVVVFSYFSIPLMYQHRILFFGILGALVFRAIFIAIGASLMQHHWVVVLAGIFLILTGAKILFAPEKIPDPGANILVRTVRRWVPVSSEIDGQKFFTKKNGVLYATPLFLALVFIEFSDIIFAIDSVPAIFAITKEPLIVFTSNIFAILGLRSLYFLLAGVVDKFQFLKYGLGLILIFVGSKMTWLNDFFGGKFPIVWSLCIIGFILLGSIVASQVYVRLKRT